MTLVTEREPIVVDGAAYLLGEQIAPTREVVESLSVAIDGIKQLVAARRVTKDGAAATIPQPLSFEQYPTQPAELSRSASPQERKEHQLVVDAHVAAVKAFTEQRRSRVPAPPVIGFVSMPESGAYFHIDHLNEPTTSVIPYEGSSTILYRLQLAEIVE